MLGLLYFYYLLPCLCAFLWFINLAHLLEAIHKGGNTKLHKRFGALLSVALVFSVLLSLYLFRN